MRDSFVRKLRSVGFLSLAITLVYSFSGLSPGVASDSPEYIAEGKKLAFSRKKGSCLACHAMDDGTLAGNGGPPLVAMKLRYPDVKRLRDQIWDSTQRNPNSLMPPFGRHGILTEEEIDKITAYVLTL